MSGSKYILYCAIRKKRLVYDTLYSILTLIYKIASDENVNIIIVTDQANLFFIELKNIDIPLNIKITIEDVDESTINDWTKNGNIYGVKIYSLKRFFCKYKQNVLFVDSDMFFINNPVSLFDLIDEQDTVLMYRKRQFDLFEIISSRREDVDDSIIMQNNKIVLNNSTYTIPFHCSCYESGVLGINYLNKNLIDNVIDFYNRFYDCFKYDNSEEIAFGYVFQNNLKIKFAYDILNHYSNVDVIRYFIGYSLKKYFCNDEVKLKEFLKHYHIKFSDLDYLDLTYDNIKYFIILFKAFVFKQKLSHENIILYALNSNTLKNTSFERKKLYEFTEKFKQVFCQ